MRRASLLGLEGVTVGDLAGELGMSKSGVLGPFGARGDLLSTALDEAGAIFRERVIAPAMSGRPGLARLRRLTDHWVDYLADCPFPGGCFLTAASVDLDARPGPLRDQLVQIVRAWREFLVTQVREGLPALSSACVEEVVTTLIGISMAANQEIQLLADPAAPDRARRAMRRVISPT